MRTAQCDRARARFSLQLDSELSRFEESLLARHLDRCAACSAFAADARAATDLLRAAPLEPAPPIALPRRTLNGRLPVRMAAAAASVAAAALVAVSSTSLLQPQATRSGAPFAFWPRGLAVQRSGDQTLGVQHVSFERPKDGPRRGLLGL